MPDLSLSVPIDISSTVTLLLRSKLNTTGLQFDLFYQVVSLLQYLVEIQKSFSVENYKTDRSATLIALNYHLEYQDH